MLKQGHQVHSIGGFVATAKAHRACASSLQEGLGGCANEAIGCSTESGSNLDQRRDGSGRYQGKGVILLGNLGAGHMPYVCRVRYLFYE